MRCASASRSRAARPSDDSSYSSCASRPVPRRSVTARTVTSQSYGPSRTRSSSPMCTKPAKLVHIGDELRVRLGPYDWLVTVRAVTERRGTGRDAQLLYDESSEGRAARERLAEAHRIAPTPSYQGKGRPTKKDRRKLELL